MKVQTGKLKAAAKPQKALGSRKAAKPAATKKGASTVTKTAKPVAKAASATKARTAAAPAKPVAAKAAAGKTAAVRKPAAVAHKPAAKKAATPVRAAPVKAKTAPAAPAAKAAPASASKSAPAKSVTLPPPPAPIATAPKPAPTATSTRALPMPIPTKPARTSRLAQLTVPSMAPAVASTAAKASYLQEMSSPMIVPAPHVAAKKDPKLANNWKTKSADQLTDAEVLAMPDSEYMNEKQTAFFRLKLVVLKQDMLNNAGETTEHLREDTVVVPDPADRATIEEEHARDLRTRDRERKLLKKISQSLARIDAGDYGFCDETGEPIGVGRLLARPTATLSLEAQQRRELKQKMFGD